MQKRGSADKVQGLKNVQYESMRWLQHFSNTSYAAAWV
jgi:hypothetical protein